MPVDIISTDNSPYAVVTEEVEEVISTHHTEHKAIESAIGASESCQCDVLIHRDLTLRVRFTPTSGKDYSTATLTWVHPDKREDGTPLETTEILSYIVEHTHNGVIVEYIVNGEQLDFGLVIAGEGVHGFRMKTIAKDYKYSKWSDKVEIER